MLPSKMYFSPAEEERAAAAAVRRDKRNITSAMVLFALALAAIVVGQVRIPAESLFAVGTAVTFGVTGVFCLLDIIWRRRCSQRGHTFILAGSRSGSEIYRCLHCREKRYAPGSSERAA